MAFLFLRPEHTRKYRQPYHKLPDAPEFALFQAWLSCRRITKANRSQRKMVNKKSHELLFLHPETNVNGDVGRDVSCHCGYLTGNYVKGRDKVWFEYTRFVPEIDDTLAAEIARNEIEAEIVKQKGGVGEFIWEERDTSPFGYSKVRVYRAPTNAYMMQEYEAIRKSWQVGLTSGFDARVLLLNIASAARWAPMIGGDNAILNGRESGKFTSAVSLTVDNTVRPEDWNPTPGGRLAVMGEGGKITFPVPEQVRALVWSDGTAVVKESYNPRESLREIEYACGCFWADAPGKEYRRECVYHQEMRKGIKPQTVLVGRAKRARDDEEV